MLLPPRYHVQAYIMKIFRALHYLNTVDTKSKESCKEVSNKGVTLKFVQLTKEGKHSDPSTVTFSLF